MTGVVIMSVADKIADELEDLHANETSPGMAAVARALALAIDETDAPTAKAVLADKLRPIMKDLRTLAPVGEEGDTVDDITRDREERRARIRSVPASGE